MSHRRFKIIWEEYTAFHVKILSNIVFGEYCMLANINNSDVDTGLKLSCLFASFGFLPQSAQTLLLSFTSLWWEQVNCGRDERIQLWFWKLVIFMGFFNSNIIYTLNSNYSLMQLYLVHVVFILNIVFIIFIPLWSVSWFYVFIKPCTKCYIINYSLLILLSDMKDGLVLISPHRGSYLQNFCLLWKC